MSSTDVSLSVFVEYSGPRALAKIKWNPTD